MINRDSIERGTSTDLSDALLPSRGLVGSLETSEVYPVPTDKAGLFEGRRVSPETTLGEMGDYLVRLGEYIGNNLYEANRRLYAGEEYIYAGKPYRFPESIESENDPAWQHWKTKAGTHLGYTNEYQAVEEIQKQFKQYGEFLKLIEGEKGFKDLLFKGLDESHHNFKYVEGVMSNGEVQDLSADFQQIGRVVLKIHERLNEIKNQTIEKHQDLTSEGEEALIVGYSHDDRLPYNVELDGHAPYSESFLRLLHRFGKFLQSEKESSLNNPQYIPHEIAHSNRYAPYCGKPISGTFDDVVPVLLPQTQG